LAAGFLTVSIEYEAYVTSCGSVAKVADDIKDSVVCRIIFVAVTRLILICAVCLWCGVRSHWKAVQHVLFGCTGQHERRATECMIYLLIIEI